MTEEQREQYLELQRLAQKEHKAEQAKVRRAAQRYIQDRYGYSIEQLDKLVNRHRETLAQRQAQKTAQAKGQQAAQDPAGKPAPQQATKAGQTPAPGSLQAQASPAASQPAQYRTTQQRQEQTQRGASYGGAGGDAPAN